MGKVAEKRALHASLALALLLAPFSGGQQVEAAPIPAQIITAKKVFISNGGVDSVALAAFKRAGDTNGPYNRFYAAMKSWGRYQLVASPADADLVFEIRFTAPIADFGKTAIYEPQLGLSIFDTKTHFVLWTFTEPVQGAFRKVTWEKNVHQGMKSLLAEIKKLAGTPLSARVDGPSPESARQTC